MSGVGTRSSLTIIRLLRSIGTDEKSDQKMRQLLSLIPMGRVTEPADVADAAWYLTSSESSFVTGIVLEVFLILILQSKLILTGYQSGRWGTWHIR